MNYGLYLSASGALTAMHRMDVAANNLANVNTRAFKPDLAFESQRPVASVEKHLPFLPSSELLERLGGGVLAAPTRTDFKPAPAEPTGGPLDVAILGEGFFVVHDERSNADDRVRLTRDGRFLVNPQGKLVTAGEGLSVLDEFDREIWLDPQLPASITPAGEVMQGGDVMARIQVAGVVDTGALEKAGEGLFQFKNPAEGGRVPVSFALQPGAVEASGVDPIKWMMQSSRAASSAQGNLRMIQMHDELMGRAINTFGRIA